MSGGLEMTTEIGGSGSLPVILGGVEHMSSYDFQKTYQDLPVGEIRRVGGSAYCELWHYLPNIV